MFFEFARIGRFEMSSFQGLLRGNTCKALKIRSASGVLNMTGCLISGMACLLRTHSIAD